MAKDSRPTGVDRSPQSPAPAAVVGTPTTGEPESLATATYIAGSSTLEPGSRYAFRIDLNQLCLLGPIDANPSVIALQLDISQVDATWVGGRLLISQPATRSGPVLAFMSIVGLAPDGLVEAIAEAARSAGHP